MVMLVAGNALLRRHAGSHHLQRIELAGHLKQRTCIGRIEMHLPHVALHDAHPWPPRHARTSRYPRPQVGQRGHFKGADAPGRTVHAGTQRLSPHFQPGTGCFVGGFLETGESGEPVHCCSLMGIFLPRFRAKSLTHSQANTNSQRLTGLPTAPARSQSASMAAFESPDPHSTFSSRAAVCVLPASSVHTMFSVPDLRATNTNSM